jgi:hypothetical protein
MRLAWVGLIVALIAILGLRPAEAQDHLDDERQAILVARKALEGRRTALISKDKTLDQRRSTLRTEQEAIKGEVGAFNREVDAANRTFQAYKSEHARWVNAYKAAAADQICKIRPAIFKQAVDAFAKSGRIPVSIPHPGFPPWHYDIHVVAHQILFRYDPGRYPWVNNKVDYKADWEVAANAFNTLVDNIDRSQAGLANRKAALTARKSQFTEQAGSFQQDAKAFKSELSAWKQDQDELGERVRKFKEKVADAGLLRAKRAIKNTDSTLKMLSRALYIGSILTKNPDLKGIKKFTDDLRKVTGELDTQADKVVKLAEQQEDVQAAEKEAETLLEKVKRVRVKNQAEELERLAKKVRELPIGLVSEDVDDGFVVSADLLIRAPKQAEARFRAYLAAMKANTEYLNEKRGQLDEASETARKASRFFSDLQLNIEKAVKFSGPYAKPLTAFYLEADALARAYGGLAADCASKADEAERAAQVEQRRHDNLADTLRTLFGFEL